ncbi:sensor histidine kinase [Streptomyces sp. CMB-StM0423]|uniref:sensor histidine kinase n=1 Tax=Streptomyces sp. CMB-StM0423 TaxID=2059884 RepID=UPI001F189D50|nr:sensor histidine kinase [Streptomyces sp. CMB-StM0423]
METHAVVKERPERGVQAALRLLAARIRDDVRPAEAVTLACELAVAHLGVAGAALRTLRRGAAAGCRARAGEPAAPAVRRPLVHQGEVYGVFSFYAPPRGCGLDTYVDQLAPMVAALVLREELRRRGDQVVAAREAERHRLRRDLHDGLGGNLASIRLRLETAADLLVHEPRGRRLVADAARTAAGINAEIRSVIDDLRPPDLAEAGLAGALVRLAARHDGSGTEVRARVPRRLRALHPAVEVAAYRIAAEGLTNALRHAAARTVQLGVWTSATALRLDIADDGQGRPPRRPLGLGIASMARRAEEVGGTLRILPRTDLPHGTLVRALLPGGTV